ncbi:Nuclear control of ATPase protein 2, variant 2 [Basidiobolus ranarum]|uniref:Nuclear control of ATPase protein 2, variant 2 n=1 Tax=Basidiobolus ranarum TaxID=34480 RepID=A0ABR2VRP1_9FUNG
MPNNGFILETVKGQQNALESLLRSSEEVRNVLDLFEKESNTDLSEYSDSNAAETVKRLWDQVQDQRIGTSVTLIPLKTIFRSLEDTADIFEVKESRESSGLVHLKWAFLSQVAINVYAQLLETLVTVTLPLSKDIMYWEDCQSSRIYTSNYLIQTGPTRVYQVLRQLYSSVEKNPNVWLSLFPSWVKALPTRNTGVLQLANREITHKMTRLKIIRKYNAACLGLMTERGLDLKSSYQDFGTMEKNLCHFLKLVKALLRQASCFDFDTEVPDINEAISSVDDHVLELVDAHHSIREILHLLTTLEDRNHQAVVVYGRPNLVTRYWLPFSIGYTVLNITTSSLFTRQASIELWLRESQATARDFLFDWVFVPMKRIWDTIRHKEQRLTLMGPESLNSDFESLERMVLNFAKKHSQLDEFQFNVLTHRVRDGDLSVVLRKYEEEIQNPFQNAIFGDLVQALLIQVQKTKVDVELAMSALDKLLRSNELNFCFIAVIPSLLIVYGIFRSIRNSWRGREGLTMSKTHQQIRDILRDVERILNNHTGPKSALDFQAQGLLLCELQLLRVYADRLPKKNRLRLKFLSDLRELESTRFSVKQRLNTMNRVYRTYKFLKP